MAIGSAIFLSVLLLIVAWQIDKRGASRKTGRVFLWIVIVALLVGAGFWAWVWVQDQGDVRSLRLEAAQVRQGLLEDYWGLKLGMSQSEVMYIKGAPDDKSHAEAIIPAEWHYGDAATTITYVLWDKRHKLSSIVCIHQGYGGECPAIAGIQTGSEEADVLRVFGPALRTEVTDHGVKFIDYGTGKRRVLFALEKGRVTSISISFPRPQ